MSEAVTGAIDDELLIHVRRKCIRRYFHAIMPCPVLVGAATDIIAGGLLL